MKILVTAFDPFGGESINPALNAVMQLPDEIEGIIIVKKELPTVFGKSVDVLYGALEEEQPDALISVGQAGGRPNITLERIAINIDDARFADNDGVKLVDTPVVEGGAAAYFATLPVKEIIRSLHDAEIPAAISNTAGTFVCNHVMYAALHYAAVNCPGLIAGFVHIPYEAKQAVGKPMAPFMPLESVVAGLEVIIRTVAGSLEC